MRPDTEICTRYSHIQHPSLNGLCTRWQQIRVCHSTGKVYKQPKTADTQGRAYINLQQSWRGLQTLNILSSSPHIHLSSMSAFSSSNWRTSETPRMGEPPRERWGARSSPAADKTGGSAHAWPGRRDRGGGGDNRSRQGGPYETTASHRTRDQAQGLDIERRARPDASDNTADTIAEGRRAYLGDLLYRVKPKEIGEMLDASGFEGRVEGIHISIDAVTGRNPGYCFVDFEARDDAERALDVLSA